MYRSKKQEKIWMDYKKGMSFEELMTIYDVNIHYITAAIKQYEKRVIWNLTFLESHDII